MLFVSSSQPNRILNSNMLSFTALDSSGISIPISISLSLHFLSRHLTTAEQQALKMEEGSSGACLIAVARLQHFGDGTPRGAMEASENEFVARIGTDGRFTYVDPRVVGVLGYLPQDLIGQVSYEYYHPEDIQKMVQLHHDGGCGL